MIREFLTIQGIGELWVEEDLVVGIEPVLFVCVDDAHNRYLFMTYDSFEDDYIFIKIRTRELCDMLQNKVTMEETFRNAVKIYETGNGGECVEYTEYDAKGFPEDKIPEKGAYYELDLDYIKRYIA